MSYRKQYNYTKEIHINEAAALCLLGVALLSITLKLTGFINWSWWLVTAPLWGGVAGIVAMVGLFFTGATVYAFVLDPILKFFSKDQRKQ